MVTLINKFTGEAKQFTPLLAKNMVIYGKGTWMSEADARLIQLQAQAQVGKWKVEPMTGADFTKLTGVGKKTAQAIQDAGITTFADLAETTPEALEGILTEAGVRFKSDKVLSWIEQAGEQ